MKVFKIVLLGQSGVGKSSLSLRYTKHKFYSEMSTTIGAAFMTKVLNINKNSIKFEIWDTAGQERYNSMVPLYYRNSHSAIIVYDVTCIQSFMCAKKWVMKIMDYTNTENNNMCIVLVGNKIDKHNRIDNSLITKFIEDTKVRHVQVSAKNDIGLHELFNMIGSELININSASQPPQLLLQHGVQNTTPNCCKLL